MIKTQAPLIIKVLIIRNLASLNQKRLDERKHSSSVEFGKEGGKEEVLEGERRKGKKEERYLVTSLEMASACGEVLRILAAEDVDVTTSNF